LDLDRNSIKDLDCGLPLLTALERLVLDDNKLDAIPEAVFSLPALTSLSLNRNPIHLLPENISQLVVRDSARNNNELTGWPTNNRI